MKTIEIDDDVYSALEAKVQGFGEKPNDVIKRLLAGSVTGSRNNASAGLRSQVGSSNSKLLEFVRSPEYHRGNAKDRYFNILRFMYKDKPEQFEKLSGYRRGGSRVQIAKSKEEISSSGRHTYPERLDGTPYWLATNLSNERKQTILEDALRYLGYADEEIVTVVKSIPKAKLTGINPNGF